MYRDESDHQLYSAAAVLIRCFIFTLVVLLIWLTVYLAAGNWTYGITSQFFDITRRDFTLANYYGMAFVKLCAYIFFLVPWLAIRSVLRQRNRCGSP